MFFENKITFTKNSLKKITVQNLHKFKMLVDDAQQNSSFCHRHSQIWIEYWKNWLNIDLELVYLQTGKFHRNINIIISLKKRCLGNYTFANKYIQLAL